MDIATLAIRITSDMSGLRAGIKEAQDQLSGFDKIASAVGKGLATYFAADAILGAVDAVIAFAGSLTDLAAKTGIGTTALQELKFAGEQVGVTLDQTTGAILQMQNRLAGGDKSAAGALTELKIAMSELSSLTPDEQFRKIASAIKEIPDPAERTKVAMDLMGKAATQVMPLIVSDMDKVIKSAHDMGAVISEETVAAMDDFGDQMSVLKTVGTGLLAGVLEPFIPLLSILADVVMTVLQALIPLVKTGLEPLVWALTLAGEALKVIVDAFMFAASVISGHMFGVRAAAEAHTKATATTQAFSHATAELAAEHKNATAAIDKTVEAMKPLVDLHKSLEDLARKRIEHEKKLTELSGHLGGADDITKATEYADAIQKMATGATVLRDRQDEATKAIQRGIDALRNLGQVATTAYNEAYRRAVGQPGTAPGDLSSRPLDLKMGMNAIPADMTEVANSVDHASASVEAFASEWEDAAAVIAHELDQNDQRIAQYVTGLDAARDAQNASLASMSDSWRGLGNAAQQAGQKLQAAVPRDFDFAHAYGMAGIVAHGSLSGIGLLPPMRGFAGGTRGYEDFGSGTPGMLHGREKVTPYGAESGGGPAVTINMSGVLLSSSPAGKEEIRRVVDDAIITGIKRSRKFSY